MDTEILARIQFAFTIGFHYLFPPLSIGIGVILVIMEGVYVRTGDLLYKHMAQFWVKIFALIFAMGVASGIVMEFQFGTNWATYSRYVGDIFGSALAAEGIFAFFLESGFLAVMVFGWERVSKKFHYFATIMVSFGSMLSAVWIVVANSWQQTPAGYHIVGEGINQRAEITDFWAMVFNPSSMDRLSHVLSGCFLAGSLFVISVAAFYILKNRHVESSRRMFKIGLVVAAFAALLQLWTGHNSAMGVSETQPAKLAAFEAHYPESAPGDMYLFGWVDDENQEVNFGVKIPGMLSWLLHYDSEVPVTGLNAFPPEDRPPVNITFQAYHIMVGIGMLIILITLYGIFLIWRGKLLDQKWYLYVAVFSVLLPQIANQLGWIAAEVGRQPWIVYGLLRTEDALSKAVDSGEIIFSLVLFSLIYALLFVVFIFLLNHKIKQGPEEEGSPDDIMAARGQQF